jgi:hypothetical protein
MKSTILMGSVVIIIAAALLLPVIIRAGSLEPSGAPAPTMKTLDEIPPTWSQKLPASERFELVLNDEAVLDKETGLVWTRDANLTDAKPWYDAIKYCIAEYPDWGLNIGGRLGWRLPTIEELQSLVDRSQSNPALPVGHPFINVSTTKSYWSSTTDVIQPTAAHTVYFPDGTSIGAPKTSFNPEVWCVRGGQGLDAYKAP